MSLEQIFLRQRPHKIGINQLRAARRIKKQREKILAAYSLTSPQWFVLASVCFADGKITAKDLAVILDVKHTYITACLSQLKSKNLLTSRQDRADNRFRSILPTTKGLALVGEIEQALVVNMAKLLPRTSEKDMRIYLRVLNRLAQ